MSWEHVRGGRKSGPSFQNGGRGSRALDPLGGKGAEETFSHAEEGPLPGKRSASHSKESSEKEAGKSKDKRADTYEQKVI